MNETQLKSKVSTVKKSVFITIAAIIISMLLSSCNAIIGMVSPETYELNDGTIIKSITSVVGERDLKTRNISASKVNQTVTYTYKNIEDPAGDVKKYAQYLIATEKFTVAATQSMKFDTDDGKFVCSKNSEKNDTDVIKITVDYGKTDGIAGTYKVTIERKNKDL